MDDAARVVMVFGGTYREHERADGPAVRGKDRGSRVGGFRQDRLRRVLPKAPAEFGRTPLLTHGAADTGISGPAGAGAAPEGARPQGSRPMSAVWCSRPSRRVDQMGKDAA